MKKLLVGATLSIAVAAVIKRVTENSKKYVNGQWSKGPVITLSSDKLDDYLSSSTSDITF